MINERIDSINENKNLFLLENNDIFASGVNVFQNLNKINLNLTSLEEDKDLPKNRIIPSYFLNKKEFNLNINEGINSEIIPKEKINLNNDNQYDFLHKIVENNEDNAPFLYSFDKILYIFKKEENIDKFNNIIKKLNNEEIKQDIILLDKKRKRNISDEEHIQKNELINKKKEIEDKKLTNQKKSNKNKRGRKTNETKDKGTHNKMVPDNIIKKIKAKIFEYPIIFLNNILNNNKSKDKLFKLDYQFINRLNREQDLKFLNMSLKDLFSKEISPKYITTKRQKDFNKIYIEKILKDQSDKTILFVFNLAFKDWLDLFTLKKTIKEIILKYDYLEKEIDYERIQKSLYSVDNLLNKIMDENDKEYLIMFIFLLYNYERWFYNKIGRKTKIKPK